MKFNLGKIFASFGNVRTKEQDNDNNDTEDIINAVEGEAFAISEKNVLFAKISELGGFFYVITITVGAFKIKTMKGAKLNIESADFNLTLNADIDEFESDSSDVSNRYITRIDFQIEKEDVPKFDKKSIKTLKLSTKKQEITFSTI